MDGHIFKKPERPEVDGFGGSHTVNRSTDLNFPDETIARSTIELFEHGILRCATWPIETLNPFTAPELAALSIELNALTQSIQARQKVLGGGLYTEIPKVDSLNSRRTLLQIRRRIRATLNPYDSVPGYAEALDLVDVNLGQSIQADLSERQRHQELDREFARAYQREIERERSALSLLTDSVDFQRALMLANPELAKRWHKRLDETAHAVGSNPKKSKVIKTEAAVLSYLFRAATRPTPGGLWAGVAPIYLQREAPATQDVEFVPGKRRVSTTVNLALFDQIVAHLRAQPRYRTYPTVRLAAAAYRVEETWWYQPRREGKHEWRAVPHVPLAAEILEVFANGEPHDVDAILDQLVAQLEANSEDENSLRSLLRQSIDILLDAEVLVSTLALPSGATDCWETLNGIGKQLTPSDREFWISKVRNIQVLCERLAERLEMLSPAEVDAAIHTIEQELFALREWAGLDGPVPTPLVLVDLRLGFEARCSETFWRGLTNSVREVLAFYESHGVAEQLRRVTLETFLGSNGEGVNRPFLEAVRTEGGAFEFGNGENRHYRARELEARLEAEVLSRQHFWYEELIRNSKDDEVLIAPASMCVGKPRAGFDGTLLLSVLSGRRFRPEWGRPHALCLASRFVQLLDHDGEEFSLAESVRKWYRSWAPKGFEPVEIVGSDSANENATMRPRLTEARITASGGEVSMADLCVGSAPGIIRPWIGRKGTDQKMIAVYNCTGAIGISDAPSQSLYRLALGHGWEFVCRRLFPRWVCERIPRMLLPGGTVISPARWFLTKTEVENLSSLNEVERYRQWVMETKRLGMPDKVMVAIEPRPDETLLYLPTTSPLAVRSLFARVSQHPRPLEFSEVHGDPNDCLIADDDGRHYASELMISWKDPQYCESVFDDQPE